MDPGPCPVCRSEWLELRYQAGRWKSAFQRCRQRQRSLQEQAEIQRQRLGEQAQERERVLQEQIITLKAQICVLEQRLRGRKSEKKKRYSETSPDRSSTTPRRRGQQPNNPAPKRRTFDHLPTQEEPCELPAAAACCPQCHAPYAPFPGSDDGDILEIEVRAYRRRYHRHRYRKTCNCTATPTLITAPPPPKLIPKGYLGISVWVLLLLEKYAAFQPTYRFLNLLRSFGVDLPLGTVTEGLKKLLPRFEPVYEALAAHQRQEHHWHCDETRWLVFVEHAGKVGHTWSLWVFQSPQVVVFVLDPTRAHHVPETHLDGATGIASVDRASVYKAMAQVKDEQIVLAFCWAHVRRDFLEVLTGHADLHDWVVDWLEEIRELYQRNDARLEALTAPATVTANNDPLLNDPLLNDPLLNDPLLNDPLLNDPLLNDPLLNDPLLNDPLLNDPLLNDPLLNDPLLNDPLLNDPLLNDPLLNDTSSTPPSANEPGTALVSSKPPPNIAVAEQDLRAHVAHLAQRCDAELQQPDLHRACTKVLTSLKNHWSGLTVFLDHPEVPLDNNAAERAERGPVVARKNYYGSGALWSGRLAAMMFSILQTLTVWNLCPLRWLTAYLTACAQTGAKPSEQAAAFLPWNLTAEQRQQWALPSSKPARPDAANTS